MKKVKTLILRAPGMNCDRETGYAFELAGSNCKFIHINNILKKPEILKNFHIIAIPGGFTFGDYVSAGKIVANIIKYKLIDQFKEFIRRGRLIIGICNGFQVLVKAGLLPDVEEEEQTVSLVENDSGRFECRWVKLKVYERSNCVFTKDYHGVIELPVAHAEGKFVVKNKRVLRTLARESQIALFYSDSAGNNIDTKYPDNPNGSVWNIAGICDSTGRVFGLMPHPERFVSAHQYYRWTKDKTIKPYGIGIFKNAVEYAKKNL